MSKQKGLKLVIISIFFILTLFVIPYRVFADVPPPPFSLKCNIGEIEIRSYDYNEKDDSCLPPTLSYSYLSLLSQKIFPYLIATIFLELPIFLLFGFKSGRDIIFIVIANIISVICLHLSYILVPAASLFYILIGEVVVIIFEYLFLKQFLKPEKLSKLWKAVLVANLVSASVGTLVILFIQSLPDSCSRQKYYLEINRPEFTNNFIQSICNTHLFGFFGPAPSR